MVTFMTPRQIACYLIGTRLREEFRRNREQMSEIVQLPRDHSLATSWLQTDFPPSA